MLPLTLTTWSDSLIMRFVVSNILPTLNLRYLRKPLNEVDLYNHSGELECNMTVFKALTSASA